MESTTLVWIMLLPLLGSAIIGVGRKGLSRNAAGWLGSLVVAVSFVLTLQAMGQLPATGVPLRQSLFVWGQSLPFELHVGLMADALTLWWLLVVTGVGFLIHVYSIGYMADDKGFARFFAELNYFIFSMALLVLADNFVGLLVGWANVGFASFLLIGFWTEKAEARAAANKALLINIAGESAMVVALALMVREFGSLAYAEIFSQASGATPGIVTAISLLLLVGIVTKSAQLPLHTWLPDAMQGPTPVSALIHAATMVTAGVYLVIRAFPLFSASPVAMQTVAVIGALSALFGAIVATRQFDIKRVLAYSTMSQLGYMLMGAGVGAYAASAFHFFTHAFFKALLFLGAGMISHHLSGEQDIRKMGGLGRQLPFVYWTFLAGVLAISGAPGFAGFFSKEEILAAALHEGHVGLWLIGVVTAGLTAYYMARLFILIFGGEASETESNHVHRGRGGVMGFPVAVLAVASTLSGLIAIPGITQVPGTYLAPVFARFGHEAVHVDSFGFPVILVLGMAAIGFIVGLKLFGPSGQGRARAQRSLQRRLGGPVANAFYLDDLYVWGAASIGRWAKVGALRVQSGFVRRYALTFFAGFAAFVFYFLLL